jgi:hypothetical protein
MVHPVFFEGLAQVKDVDLPVSVFIQLREELPQPFFIFERELVQVLRCSASSRIHHTLDAHGTRKFRYFLRKFHRHNAAMRLRENGI